MRRIPNLERYQFISARPCVQTHVHFDLLMMILSCGGTKVAISYECHKPRNTLLAIGIYPFPQKQKKNLNKISKSSARHLRRKHLLAAKKQNQHISNPNPDVYLDSTVTNIPEKLQNEQKEEEIMTSTKILNPDNKPVGQLEEKSRDQVKADREAKKAAKAAAKAKKSEKGGGEKPVMEQSESKDTVDFTLTISRMKPESKQVGEISVANSTEKSGSELKAERRRKQEGQRAAKLQKQTEQQQLKKEQMTLANKAQQKMCESKQICTVAKKPEVLIADDSHEVGQFKHLYIERKRIEQQFAQNNPQVHPAILRLGVQYAERIVVGSNARCVALLAAVKQLIEDYVRPSQADFTRGLETSLQEAVAYLNYCRPIAVSMQNALRHLKWQMSTLSSQISDKEAKLKLTMAIDTYINDQINLADKAISISIQKKISQDDIILTYGFSSLIQKILCDAHNAGKQFRVVVVDSRPYLEGKELLRRLVKQGLDCSYVLINALSYIMPQVSKVFLGAHAILANGAVMSRVGTAQIALMAKTFNVPVLVACETHKSCEQVQTDSIVFNEIGDPDLLAKNCFTDSKKSCLSNWRSRKCLKLLNLTYDVTPADLVSAVVTELSILPCTSVPVILRIKPPEL